MRETTFTKDTYPAVEDIGDKEKGLEFLTPCLRTFVEKTLPPCAIRQSSVGQVILQSLKPRSVIAPILFGLGVQMDHVFGSRWLIDELHQLGFSISYDEVGRYKQSVMEQDNIEDLRPPMDQTFTQWAGDNVDHNIRTLSGEGTFHGMWVIAMYSAKSHSSNQCVVRKAR